MSVTLSSSAVGDLEEIVAHYEDRDGPEVGRRLVSEILDRIETLSTFPDAGRVVPELDTPALRELIHPPFRVIYRRQPRRVQVIRVWRSERMLKLPTISGRLSE